MLRSTLEEEGSPEEELVQPSELKSSPCRPPPTQPPPTAPLREPSWTARSVFLAFSPFVAMARVRALVLNKGRPLLGLCHLLRGLVFFADQLAPGDADAIYKIFIFGDEGVGCRFMFGVLRCRCRCVLCCVVLYCVALCCVVLCCLCCVVLCC